MKIIKRVIDKIKKIWKDADKVNPVEVDIFMKSMETI